MKGENSDSSGSYSDSIGTRLSIKTHRQFEEYKDENELSDAEALRRLTRQALGSDDTTRERLFLPALVGNAAFYAAYFSDGNRGAAFVGLSFMLVMLFWSTWPSTVEMVSRTLVFVRGESTEDSKSNEVQT